MSYLLLYAYPEADDVNQVQGTMTLRELIILLQTGDPDMPVFVTTDNGKTYGGITEANFREAYTDDGDDWK